VIGCATRPVLIVDLQSAIVYLFPKWRPSAILDLFFSLLDHIPRPIDGLYFPCRWQSDVTQTLRFYDFADLAGKCLFAPIFGQFEDFILTH